MKLNDILDALFPEGHRVDRNDKVLIGEATLGGQPVAVLGTTDAAAVDHAIALSLAAAVLATIEKHPGRPLLFLVDTSGQALSRSQELLCLNGSLAHLAECVDLARRRGHPSLALVTANAVSGGFLSFGLMADVAYALQDAQVRVMDLRAMSRVTKIPLEQLGELAGNSPIFAPGAENYQRMGGIEAIWPAPSPSLLAAALDEAVGRCRAGDPRMAIGRARGGRQLAATIAERVAGY